MVLSFASYASVQFFSVNASLNPPVSENLAVIVIISSLENSSKWALSMGMILGRLELFAILVLFIPSFWRKF